MQNQQNVLGLRYGFQLWLESRFFRSTIGDFLKSLDRTLHVSSKPVNLTYYQHFSGSSKGVGQGDGFVGDAASEYVPASTRNLRPADGCRDCPEGVCESNPVLSAFVHDNAGSRFGYGESSRLQRR